LFPAAREEVPLERDNGARGMEIEHTQGCGSRRAHRVSDVLEVLLKFLDRATPDIGPLLGAEASYAPSRWIAVGIGWNGRIRSGIRCIDLCFSVAEDDRRGEPI